MSLVEIITPKLKRLCIEDNISSDMQKIRIAEYLLVKYITLLVTDKDCLDFGRYGNSFKLKPLYVAISEVDLEFPVLDNLVSNTRRKIFEEINLLPKITTKETTSNKIVYLLPRNKNELSKLKKWKDKKLEGKHHSSEKKIYLDSIPLFGLNNYYVYYGYEGGSEIVFRESSGNAYHAAEAYIYIAFVPKNINFAMWDKKEIEEIQHIVSVQEEFELIRNQTEIGPDQVTIYLVYKPILIEFMDYISEFGKFDPRQTTGWRGDINH